MEGEIQNPRIYEKVSYYYLVEAVTYSFFIKKYY